MDRRFQDDIIARSGFEIQGFDTLKRKGNLQIRLNILPQEQIREIAQEAYRALKEIGVLIQNEEAADLLLSHDAEMLSSDRISIPEEMIENALSTDPSSIKLYDKDRNLPMNLEGDYVRFNPGSAAMTFSR